jgi:NADH-quinone oxidoreductase subunit G
MEGFRGEPPSPLIAQFWAPGWNSNQALNKYQDEVGGPLRDEWPGIRLIEADTTADAAWFTAIPEAFHPTSRQWLLLPMAEVFGSEPFSRRSPAVAERMPAPYLALSSSDATKLGATEGSTVELTLQGVLHHLVIRVASVLPPGTAGLFVPTLPASALPARVDLHQAARLARRAA